MDLQIIPGVRQDHMGRNYRIGLKPDGTQVQVFCDAAPLTARAQAAMQPVTVVSKAYLAAQGLEPKNELQRIRLQRVLDAGPTYNSLACYQRRLV